MKSRVFFAIPGDLETLTGGYGYDRRVLACATSADARLEYLELSDGFPFPSPAEALDTLDRLRAAPNGSVLLVDGLAFGALPPGGLATIAHPIVALVHHPLGLETGLDEAASRALIANERATLAQARAIIATSATTRQTLIEDFAVKPDMITVAEPGVDPAPRAARSGGPTVQLLAVGAVVPRKGFDVLIEALAGLRDLDWRLRIVGGLDRAPETTIDLRARIATAGLSGRVTLAGAMQTDALGEVYAATDLFVMSSRYEGYGMVLAEAMARGLPIVTTTGGAAALTVPNGAGIKVPPDDALALSGALRRAIESAELRAQLAEASWRAGQSLPRWDETTRIILDVLERVA